MKDELKKYRQGLADVQHKLNENYDKLIVTLSGGALALSIVFLKDVAAPNTIKHSCLLIIAWFGFILSLASTILEILFGIHSHKKAIKQIDDKSIYEQKVGGRAASWSTAFHWLAAISLIVGLVLIAFFAFFNLGGTDSGEKTSTKTATESTANPPGTKAAN